MYLSSVLKDKLRPFAPVLLPIYRRFVAGRSAIEIYSAERARAREDAVYPEQIRALVQGLRRAPARYGPEMENRPDVPGGLRHIAAIVSGAPLEEADKQLSGAELKTAQHLLLWWSRAPVSTHSIKRLTFAMRGSSMGFANRVRLDFRLHRAFRAALNAHDVLAAQALLELFPEKRARKMAQLLDARLPMKIARSFVPDLGDASLEWMDHFPGSRHHRMRAALVRAVQTDTPDLLRKMPYEYFERIILNSCNLSAAPDGPYYRFLDLVRALLPAQINVSSPAQLIKLNALIERKKMRGDVLKRDYEAALKRARALCRFPKPLPEDLYARIDLLNKLGRTAQVQRYVRRVRFVHVCGGAPARDIALSLWAAGSPQSALGVLGDPNNWAGGEQTASVALRSLLRLRRFEEAGDLARRAAHWPALYGQVKLAQSNALALRSTGVAIPQGEDAALHMLPHWLAAHKRAPAPSYRPEPRRVLIYSHSMGIGGAERQVSNLVSGLCEDEEASSVHLLLKERPQNAYELSASARFSTHDFASLPDDLPAPWCDHPLFGEIFKLCRPLGLSGISQVLRAIYTLRPEVVHVRGGLHAEVVLGAVLAGVPRVVVHFGSMTRGQQSSGTEIEMLRETLVERAIGLCADYPQVVLAANSRAAANDWARAAGLPEARMDVLYNAIDAQELGYRAPAPFEHTPKRALVVGGVFRFAPVKDPLLWVEVARLVHAALPETRFLLIGDGPMRKSVERAIEAAGLTEQFELPGLITKDLFPYLRRMDLSLMTTRTESLPNAVIEAQLAGLPVVAPDVGGMAEAIADSDTARLPERSAPALAAAVIAGLQDIEWRKDVYERAPELILEKFSRKRQLESTKAVYGWSH